MSRLRVFKFRCTQFRDGWAVKVQSVRHHTGNESSKYARSSFISTSNIFAEARSDRSFRANQYDYRTSLPAMHLSESFVSQTLRDLRCSFAGRRVCSTSNTAISE